MNVTLFIADEIFAAASRRAESMGTNVDQLLRGFLEQFARETDPAADAAEFERLSLESNGDSLGRGFERDELHEQG